MTNEQLIYGYFEKSLNGEELKLFREKFLSDPEFASQVKMQANMLVSLRASDAMTVGANSAFKSGFQKWFSSKRLLLVIPFIIILIAFLTYLFIAERVNSEISIPSSKDSTINWVESRAQVQIDTTLSIIDNSISIPSAKSFTIIHEGKTDFKPKDSSGVNPQPKDSNFQPKPSVANHGIDSCKLFRKIYGKQGSRFRISLTTINPYTFNQLLVQVKELFTIEDFLNSDIINTSSEEGSLAIQRMIFISVVSTIENKPVNPNLQCDKDITISIPLKAGYKDMTVMQMKSHAGANNYNQQIVRQNDSIFCVFNSNYFGGYNLGKPIKPGAYDFKLRAGEIFWQPQVINCIVKNDKEDFIVTGSRDHKDTYTFPGDYNKRKTWVYMKIHSKGTDYVLKVRLSECSYYPKTNFYSISKELFERKAKAM